MRLLSQLSLLFYSKDEVKFNVEHMMGCLIGMHHQQNSNRKVTEVRGIANYDLMHSYSTIRRSISYRTIHVVS